MTKPVGTKCSYKVGITTAEGLQETLAELESDGYRIRQIYQEPAATNPRYVVFAERRREEEGQNKQNRPVWFV